MTFTFPGLEIVSQIQPKLKDQTQLDALIENLAAAEQSRKQPPQRKRFSRTNEVEAAKVIKSNRPDLSDVEIAAEVGLPNSSALSKDTAYKAIRNRVNKDAKARSRIMQDRDERAKTFRPGRLRKS